MLIKSLPFVLCAALISVSVPVSAQEVLKPVKLMTVNTGSAPVTRQFFGHTAARQSVDLAFQVSGQVVDFPVKEGAYISEGDLVAQLDLEPFELSLAQAQLQFDQAERTTERLAQLSGSTASKVQSDDAQTQLALAKIALRNAEYALEHATLSAPFEALVASRSVANFTTIASGTPIVRLHDMSQLHIEVAVPEVLFLSNAAGPNMKVWAEFPSQDGEFPLSILEYDAEASTVGQSFNVTFAMDVPAGMRILPGASVTVIVELNDRSETIVLPKTAVHVDADGTAAVMVFVPQGETEGVISKQTVEIEPHETQGIVVLSGLDAASEIVSVGGAALSDGQAVRRFVGFGN